MWWRRLTEPRTIGDAATRLEAKPSDLILSCPPAGPTTAYESLFSNSRHAENFVFDFRTRRPRSSRGRPEALEGRRMATGTSRLVAVLRDARILRQAQERAPQDEADG